MAAVCTASMPEQDPGRVTPHEIGPGTATAQGTCEGFHPELAHRATRSDDDRTDGVRCSVDAGLVEVRCEHRFDCREHDGQVHRQAAGPEGGIEPRS